MSIFSRRPPVKESTAPPNGQRQVMLCLGCAATFKLSPSWIRLPTHKFHNGELCRSSDTTNFRTVKEQAG